MPCEKRDSPRQKAGFVILHYGKMDVTKRCLDSIFSLYGAENAEVLVVDNDPANGDGSGNEPIPGNGGKWKDFGDRSTFHALSTGGGKGFSEANNLGYAWMRKYADPDVLVIGNNDLVFEQRDFLERLEKDDLSGFDVCGPDIVVKDTGLHQNPMGRHLPTAGEAERTIRLNEQALRLMPFSYPYVSRWLKRQETAGNAEGFEAPAVWEAGEERNEEQGPLVLHGSCLILGRRFIEREEKAFDPETNFYYEEYILTRRCMKKGYRIAYCPSLRVVHDAGRATSDSVRSRMEYVKRKLRNTADACRVYRGMMGDPD